MTRGLSASMTTEITSDEVHMVLLIKMELDSGDLNLWTGLGAVTFNGDVYQGAGELLAISSIEETTELKAGTITGSLSGLDASVLSDVLNEPYQGRNVTIYLGFMDSSLNIISDPIQWAGFLDQMTPKDNADSIDIAVTIESELIAQERALNTLYTTESQKREFPNDTALDFIPGLQNKEVIWG